MQAHSDVHISLSNCIIADAGGDIVRTISDHTIRKGHLRGGEHASKTTSRFSLGYIVYYNPAVEYFPKCCSSQRKTGVYGRLAFGDAGEGVFHGVVYNTIFFTDYRDGCDIY